MAECIRFGMWQTTWASSAGKEHRNHENHLLGFDTCYLWSKRNNGVFKHCKSTFSAKGLRVMGD